ncbi:MAG: molecular chaperone TorD family protein [Pseudomonadota bacterium]
MAGAAKLGLSGRRTQDDLGKAVEVQSLLALSAAFRVLAQGFAYPVAGHRADVLAGLEAAARSAARVGSPTLARALRRSAGPWQERTDEMLAAEYLRLFRAGGPVSLHETAYGDARRIAGRAVELADIAGFYAAFGFRLTENEPDLPDHLCPELEFYSLLLLKLAYASRSGWSPGRQVVRGAARLFLQHHLGRWAGALVPELNAHDADAPYRELVRLLDTLVRLEIKRSKVAPLPATGRLPHDPMQEDDFACPRELAGMPPSAPA